MQFSDSPFYFLDWCPRATNAIEPVPFSLAPETLAKVDIGEAGLDELKPFSFSLRSCDYRTDGLIIFCLDAQPRMAIDDKGVSIPAATDIAYEPLIAAAAYASNHLKSVIGHTHLYDTDYYAKRRKIRYKSVSKHPALINKSCMSTSPEAIIKSNYKLIELKSDNKSGEARRSVLLIRERFSKIFDKSFKAISHMKSSGFAGAVIYRNYFFIFTAVILLCAALSPIQISNINVTDIISTGLINLAILAATLTLYYVTAKHVCELRPARAACKWIGDIATKSTKKVAGILSAEARKSINAFWINNKIRILIIMLLFMPLAMASDIAAFLAERIPDSFAGILTLIGIKVTFFSVSHIARNFDLQLFLWNFLDNIINMMAPAAIFIFIAEISVKRRKSLQILNRARGIMQFGSIYNGVANNVFASGTIGAQTFNFEFLPFCNAQSIIESRIELEKRKRLRTYLLCIFLFVSSLSWRYEILPRIF